MPGDASSATWRALVTWRPERARPLGGPFVHGRGHEQFLYLSWSAATPEGGRAMFRRAKLRLDLIPEEVAERFRAGEELRGEVGLRMPDGTPRCGSVRPPAVRWMLG